MSGAQTGGAQGNVSALPAPGQDAVSLIIGGTRIAGWQAVKITRGCERLPSSAELLLTERYPTQPTDSIILPGSPCQVMIGSDLVITGYVDRYMPEVGPRAHEVRIIVRSTCEDLVDCSAMFQTYQISNTTLVQLATQLAAPFGITVSAPDGDSGVIPQFAVVLTETPYEIIERVARYAGKLVYDGTDGNLIIAGVATTAMASGFVQGVNVQRDGAAFTMDQRYTVIAPLYLSTSVLTNTPEGGQADIPYIPNAAATDTSFPLRADGKPRYRPLLLVSEQAADILAYAKQRAAWEMARRIGRSQMVRLVCDSWRDSAGALWAPNATAPIQLPALKLSPTDPWVIGEVSFVRDDQGQRAEIMMMPKQAFVPEPINLLPFTWQVNQALDPNGARRGNGTTDIGTIPYAETGTPDVGNIG